jgi:multicomponent Na+:H+ antiporter subunit A
MSMPIALIVGSGFAMALLAPWLVRVAKGAAPWILSLLPLAQTGWLLSYLPLVSSGKTIIVSYPWVPSLGLSLSFHLDGLSLLFALLITSIGVVVVVYGGDYLKGHARQGLFFGYLFLFSSSMLGIVLADNLLLLYAFWELTTLASYLLIGFEHEEEKVRASARQALLVTSGGGLAMLAGFVLLAQAGGSDELSTLLDRGDMIRAHPFYGAILLLILAGAMAKSAQWPLHFWLPNAMQAPTPVSAYLHSATMVKAGIYLLGRLNPVLGGTELWMGLLIAIGLLTMVMGAALAVPQRDIKLILAYATVSVLGMLVLLLGVGTELAVEAAMTYLFAHALYKGALFLVAGIMDHEAGTRDVTAMSGLGASMPGTAVAAGAAALSMAGLPPFLGYVAKETVYDAMLHGPVFFSGLLAATVVFASLCFVAVAGIAGIRPFVGGRGDTPKEPHGTPASMWIAAGLLSLGGILFGIFSSWVDRPLIAPAVGAVRRHAVEVDLVLWHGWTLPLLLSGVSLAAGLLLYREHHRIRHAVGLAEPWLDRGPAHWYEVGIAGMNRLALAQTALWQHGYLRYYLLLMVLTGLGTSGYVLLSGEGLQWPAGDLSWIRYYELTAAFLIIISTMAVVRAETRLASVAALAGVGYGVTLVFVLFGAPDLALTQVLVETLMVTLFAYVLYRMPSSIRLSSGSVRSRDALVATLTGGVITALVLSAERLPLPREVSRYYSEHSLPDAHGHNVVNTILVDFRSLDTMGEIVVLATAAIGVYGLLKLRLESKEIR